MFFLLSLLPFKFDKKGKTIIQIVVIQILIFPLNQGLYNNS